MIRVVHVITKLELGGAQENTLYTLGHLDPARFSGLLVTHPEGLLVADALEDSRYGKRFVRSLVREVRPARDGIALAALVGILRREVREARGRVGAGTPPVIVHTHSSKAGILGRAAARLAGVPVVIHTVHGFGFHPRQRPGVRRFYIALERLAARWTTHVIAVAQADLDEGVALGLFPRERASLIRSGIEIARYTGDGDRPGGGGPRPRVRPGAAAGRDGGLSQTAEKPRGFRPGGRARRRKRAGGAVSHRRGRGLAPCGRGGGPALRSRGSPAPARVEA